ncbi:AAA family ATPase [Solitalea koreensis]|uniref:Nicotinamide-nucleotide adenylyltransferase, NadR type n=1 Tax=Solitalea koreensis TaxID=543615 RepID=A0A521C7W7_9SPHI|nr:ATP-binding protein [Solitalea koreensis]SMO55498.1 nicotinamide-nucleotide adenylyltransferase, NadR type [Solitalea koreensis]
MTHKHSTKSPILKIAIIGPESTGKSTMAKHLANHYNTIWVPEYAREYCEGLDRECTLQDELNMFYGQLALEEKLIPKANQLLICDVTILNVKVWCDEVFGGTPDFVTEEIKNRHYDFYLLMNIDTEWEPDPQRNFPDKRQYFFDLYERELNALNANYEIISGLGETRFRNAEKVIDAFLK